MIIYEGYYNDKPVNDYQTDFIKEHYEETTFVGGISNIYLLQDGTYIYTDSLHELNLTEEEFISSGNIKIDKTHIIMSASISLTDEQYEELKRVIRFHRNNTITIEFLKTDNSSNIIAEYIQPVVEIVLSQIVRYFKENILPSGFNWFDDDNEDYDIAHIIANNRVTYSEALRIHSLNEGLLDFDYKFDSIYQDVDFNHIMKILESDGIVRRFDNIFEDIVNKIYNNYHNSLIATGYSYYSIIRRKPNEDEKDFINRCCGKTSDYINEKDWHPIFILITNRIDVNGSVSRRIVLDYYRKFKRGTVISNEKDNLEIFDNDPIIIKINPENVEHSITDISRTLQHEFTHAVDLFNGNNPHLYQKKSFISNIEDVFDIKKKFNESFYKIIKNICYLVAEGEQVAFKNGLDRDLQYRIKSKTSPNVLIKETEDISNLGAMKYYWELLNRNDVYDSLYVYLKNLELDKYNILMVIMFITLAYYFKIHEQDEFKDFDNRLINYDFIYRMYRELKKYLSKDIVNTDELFKNFDGIKLRDFYIDEKDYIAVKERVLNFILDNFNNYARNVEDCIENVLIKKGYMSERDKMKYRNIDKQYF